MTGFKEGTATTSVYAISYNEDRWYRFTEKQREECCEAWIKKAEPMDVEEVVLKLIPDPIFPQHGKEHPYIAWRHKFPNKDVDDWIERRYVEICTNDNTFVLDEEDREKFKTYCAKHPKGTRIVLTNVQGRKLWELTT